MSWNGVFMAEIQKHECLYNKYSREYRNKDLRNECWQKVGDKFGMCAMDAEKKFRNIRTAYGRWLRKKRSNPTRTSEDCVPFAFENCGWLAMHIVHRDSSLSSETTGTRPTDSGSDDDDSPVTMSNIEFLNFGDYNNVISPSNDNKDFSTENATTHSVETKSTLQQEPKENPIQTSHSNEASAINAHTENQREVAAKQLASYSNDNGSNIQPQATQMMETPNTATPYLIPSMRNFHTEQLPFNNSAIATPAYPRKYDSKRKYSELEDEDELYCRSLVPRLRRLTPQAKAYVRIQLEQLLYHVEYSGATPQIGAPFGFQTQPTSFVNSRPTE